MQSEGRATGTRWGEARCRSRPSAEIRQALLMDLSAGEASPQGERPRAPVKWPRIVCDNPGDLSPSARREPLREASGAFRVRARRSDAQTDSLGGLVEGTSVLRMASIRGGAEGGVGALWRVAWQGIAGMI